MNPRHAPLSEVERVLEHEAPTTSRCCICGKSVTMWEAIGTTPQSGPCRGHRFVTCGWEHNHELKRRLEAMP